MNKPFVPSDPKTQGYRSRRGFLDAAEERRLALAWRENGDVVARNRLVTAYEPLAMSTAKRFAKTRRLDDPDLVQHAYIGLLKAADGFDAERGFRFSTYAVWWIRAELQDYRLKTWSLVRRGRSAKARKVFFNLGRLEDAVERATDESLEQRDRRLADRLDVDPDELDSLRREFSGTDNSLNQPSADGEGEDIINHLPDPDCDVEHDVAERHDLAVFRRTVMEHFAKLPDRERDIVVSTILKDPPMTLQQLGEIYGISRERVRQLRERGLERLREGMQGWSWTGETPL